MTRKDHTRDLHMALPTLGLGHECGPVNQCLGTTLHANKKSQIAPKPTKF